MMVEDKRKGAQTLPFADLGGTQTRRLDASQPLWPETKGDADPSFAGIAGRRPAAGRKPAMCVMCAMIIAH